VPATAVGTKKLDLKVGDRVEIDGRRYDVVSDKAGGVALETMGVGRGPVSRPEVVQHRVHRAR
jgi:hypothetical protein